MKKYLNINICDSKDCSQQKRGLKSAKNDRPFSRTPLLKSNQIFDFEKILHSQTPQTKVNQKSTFVFKTPKYKGVIQKTILQRLDFYQKQNQNKKLQSQMIYRSIQNQKSTKQLKQKPQINQISKSIYQKVRQQRNLSPNILQRFREYQVKRANKQARYDLLRNCSFTIKNDTVMCKHILQDKDLNRSKSKSQSKLNYMKNKSQSKIEKLIKTMDKISNIQEKHKKTRKQDLENTPTKNSKQQLKLNKSIQLSPKFNCNFNQFNHRYVQSTQNFIKVNQQSLNDKINSLYQRIRQKQKSPFYKKQKNPNKWYVKPY